MNIGMVLQECSSPDDDIHPVQREVGAVEEDLDGLMLTDTCGRFEQSFIASHKDPIDLFSGNGMLIHEIVGIGQGVAQKVIRSSTGLCVQPGGGTGTRRAG